MKSEYPRLRLDQSVTYQIWVQGRLDSSWSAWFDNLSIKIIGSESGTSITALTGLVQDQIALHSLLNRIRDLGLPLLLVQCLEVHPEPAHNKDL